MSDPIRDALREANDALQFLLNDDKLLTNIERAARVIIDSLEQEGRIFSCGNGGSLSDAMHFAEELTGRYRKNRKGLAATAISDPTHITCVANDFGFEYIFSKYIESHGKKGDVLFALTTSGKSANILNAIDMAREHHMSVITLTGKIQSPAGTKADIDLCTPVGRYSDRVQELHIKIIHMLVELIERYFFPEHYE